MYLKDLGYYNLGHLRKISQAGCYFLSRYRNGTNCYIKDADGQFKEVFISDLVPEYDITNADESMLPYTKIRLIYALRWQIELIFKIWKSVFNIDKEVKKMNIFRFECYLYGRLMAILLSEKIQNLYRDYLWEEEQLEISEFKCAKIIKKKLNKLRKAIEMGAKAVLAVFDKIFQEIVKKGLKEKKKLAHSRNVSAQTP